jgi:hypothetical protein
MRHVGLVLLLVLPALSTCNRHASPGVWQRAAGSLSSTALRAHVEYLTDDLLEGRRAGTRNETLAARYVAAQLEASGLRVESARHPLALARVAEAHLSATHGNVRVDLVYGADFLLLSAPRLARISVDAPRCDTTREEDWPRLGPSRARATLVPIPPDAALRLAVSPAAALQLVGAQVHVEARLDTTELLATAVIARLPGTGKCEVTLDAHHDGFGADFPGAADGAAGVALLLEVGRGLAAAGTPPPCAVTLRSYGDGEWAAEHHPTSPVAPLLVARSHTVRDRIGRDWDWENFRRHAQGELERLGRGR